MKYTQIPFVDKSVSRIVLGGSGSRFIAGDDVSDVMEAALEQGINCVDTARVYGRSEETIGRYFRQTGRRDDFVLVSKCCHPTLAFLSRVNRQAAEEDLMRSLELLNTDHIDVYLLHRDDMAVDVGKVAQWMNRLHEEGRIGAFGGSNWSAERIAALNAYAEKHGLIGFTVSSPHYSLGRQVRDPWGNGCKTITGAKNAGQRAWYADRGMPLFCWASLCGGVFSGAITGDEPWQILRRFGFNTAWGYECPDNYARLRRCQALAAELGVTVPQITLAWVLGSELNTLAVVGCSSPRRVMENTGAAELELTANQRRWLDQGIS